MSDESDRLTRVEVTLEHIRLQMDKVAAVVGIVTKLQTDHEYHGREVARLQERIDGLERMSNDHEKKDINLHSSVDERIDATNSKIERYKNIGVGLSVGVGAVLGAVLWLTNNNLVSILNALASAGGAK